MDTIAPARVGLVIPTLNGAAHLDRLLPALAAQTLRPGAFLVVDSGSTDGTAAAFRRSGARVHEIAADSFDHGGTRQLALEMLTEAEVVLFLTQDAVPAHAEAFASLLAPFADARLGAAYGRQVPAPGADPIAAHARLFNYPGQSHVRSMADAARFGLKAAFCSNSFAAYRRTALLGAGGFPRRAIHGEDMLAAAALLADGWLVHYVAEARVEHSHDYDLAHEFRRYFDIGVLHATARDLTEVFGAPEGEGWRYVRSELAYLAGAAPGHIPRALTRSAAKYLAYRLGRLEARLPRPLKLRLSMNRRYWSPAAKGSG